MKLEKDSSGGQTPGKVRPRRWHLRLAAVLLVVLALYIFRTPILRAVAGVLIVDDLLQSADYALILDGDRRYEEAARLYHTGYARQVLVIDRRLERSQAIGVLPSWVALARREMALRGVPEDAVVVVPGNARDIWQEVRCLRDWLCEHPNGNVMLLCDRFQSRRKCFIARNILGAELAERVRFRALPDRRYSEIDWWQRKEGVLDWFDSSIGLGHVWLCGESGEQKPPWSLDEYQASLP